MQKAKSELVSMFSTVNALLFCLMAMSLVGMNLLANKMIDTGLEFLPLDGGIMLSWLCFLTMDVLTHCYGPRTATVLSWVAMGVNLFMAAIFFAASKIPGVWGESFVTGSEQVINTALNNTFGGTWYIILGSSIAFAVSALANNFSNWSIGKIVGNKGFGTFALRSYVSTFFAQFVDNLTFGLLVSRLFFGWTLLQCVTCALTGAALELFFEVVFSPIGYRIARSIGMSEVVRSDAERRAVA